VSGAVRVASVAGKTGSVTLVTTDVTGLEPRLATVESDNVTGLPSKVPLAQRAAANGVATLDAGVLVPTAQIPSPMLSGAGAPSSGLGKVGDFYVDTTGQLFYGPKASGGTTPWGVPLALGGEAISVGLGLPGEILPQFPAGLGSTSTIVPTAARAFWYRYRPTRARALIGFRLDLTVVASANDLVDVGLYTVNGDGSLTRVASTGSVASLLNGGSARLVLLSLAQNVDPTATYVVGLAFEGAVAGTITFTLASVTTTDVNKPALFGAAFPNLMTAYKASSFPLPSSVSAGGFTGTTSNAPLLAAVEV